MGTPHINAQDNDFANVVLMPGDPVRAKWIADTFLHDYKEVTNVRGMLGFTGYTKNNIKISVMASGMGQPSIGIYSYELFNFYGVERIIRIGSCGSYQPNVNLFDVIIAQGSCTDSNYANQYNLGGTFSALGTYNLIEKAVNKAKEMKVNYHVGNVLSSDVFYGADPNSWKKWAEMGVLSVEMESYALYCNAAYLHKKALTILTVSDSFTSHKETTAEERQNSFTQMMEIALELI